VKVLIFAYYIMQYKTLMVQVQSLKIRMPLKLQVHSTFLLALILMLVLPTVFKPKFAEPQRSRDEREQDNSDFYNFGVGGGSTGGYRGMFC
jgi:hypothetical protein